MRNLYFSAVLSLFLLVPASITWAQITKTINGTVSYHSGMSETKFATPGGDVVVNLPQSLSGAVVTGTVSLNPAGKTEKEKKHNLEDLMKLSVFLGGQRITPGPSPQTFDWQVPAVLSQRTAVELRNAAGSKLDELSLPPEFKTSTIINPGIVAHFSTPSNFLVDGDAINVYTDHQFSPTEKFLLTDSRGLQFTLSPFCLSAQQAVLTLPAAVNTGDCSIFPQGMSQSISAVRPAHFTLIRMSITSPNTNLRAGQVSNVTVQVDMGGSNPTMPLQYIADPKITDKDSAEAMQIPIQLSVDLQNLNPNIVTMEGGNWQRVSEIPHAGLLEITRNIQGNVIGTFSVSATLHEDYNTCNDPFRPQENVLETPTDFNNWTNALKKDLGEYRSMQTNDGIKNNIQSAIDHLPNCASADQLNECKAVAWELLRPLNIPKGSAVNWSSSYEAARAEVQSIGTTMIPATFDYDVLKDGLEFVNRFATSQKNISLQNQCSSVGNLIDNIQASGNTAENLQELKSQTNSLMSAMDKATGGNVYNFFKPTLQELIRSGYQMPSLAPRGQVHPVNDLIGYLDPKNKTLMIAPGAETKVLAQYNATKLANGNYHIQAFNINHIPVFMDVKILLAPKIVLFEWSNDFLNGLKKLVDSLNKKTSEEGTRGDLVYWWQDSTLGTWCRSFDNAKCTLLLRKGETNCFENKNLWYVKGGQQEEGKNYYKLSWPDYKICQKGKGQCQEYLTNITRKRFYKDKNCTDEISYEDEWGFLCQ